jgi:hypothetical protein
VGQRWNDCFWCFEVLDSLPGYDDQFKLQYATAESYPNWEKAGFDPETWQRQRFAPLPAIPLKDLSAVIFTRRLYGGVADWWNVLGKSSCWELIANQSLSVTPTKPFISGPISPSGNLADLN